MALTLIEQVRWRYGDTTVNPFYPVLSDDEIQDSLDRFNNNIDLAVQECAQAAAFYMACRNNREYVGDVEIWNEAGKNYKDVLKTLVSGFRGRIPNGVMPYAAGTSVADMEASFNDPDKPIPPLTAAVRHFYNYCRCQTFYEDLNICN